MKNKKKVVYLLGRVDVERYWEAFEKADDDLSGRGYAVLNPARLPEGLGEESFSMIDCSMISVADVCLCLPGAEGERVELIKKIIEVSAQVYDKGTVLYYDLELLCKEVPAV